MEGLLLAALLGGLVLGVLYGTYRLAFFYEDPQADPLDYKLDARTRGLEERLNRAIEAFQAAPAEEVSIGSFDGLTLTGRYYHVADHAPLLLQFHGYKANAIREFCGVWSSAKALGCNVLLVDQRCHRTSQGHTITFGILEQRDCLAWVEYARRRFGDVPMMLMGVSMGASTVLMAGGKGLPDCVKGIVADCPYDTPSNILKRVLEGKSLPVGLVYPLVRLGGMLFGRFDLEHDSPLKALKDIKCPILLLHGDKDDFVPLEMSRKLWKAAPETIEFHIIPGGGHARNQIAAPELYGSHLTAFVKKWVGSGGPV